MYIGHDEDVDRFASGSDGNYEFAHDNDIGRHQGFGSVHVAGCNMAFCDGSVHTINYGIDSTVHKNLCNRRDGTAIDISKFSQ